MSAGQYIQPNEAGELHRLLVFLGSLKAISPKGFELYDSNGERLGVVGAVDAGVWAFHFREEA